MTVHRVGPAEEKEQHTVSLGRVLVTTTDLEALTEILRSRIYSDEALVKKPQRHKIEFDGGYFDEISDLPTLSDDEAQNLRLQGKGVQVILSPDRAVAIGDKREAEEIYNLWARKRQTKEWPSNRPLTSRPMFNGLLISVFFTGLLMWSVASQMTSRPIWAYVVVGTILFVPIVVFVTVLVLVITATLRILPERLRPASLPSHAVIVPYTSDEYRRNRSISKYPRTQTVIAIVSTVVAVLSVSATVIIAYYKT